MDYNIPFGNILLLGWWPWGLMGCRPLYIYVLGLHAVLCLVAWLYMLWPWCDLVFLDFSCFTPVVTCLDVPCYCFLGGAEQNCALGWWLAILQCLPLPIACGFLPLDIVVPLYLGVRPFFLEKIPPPWSYSVVDAGCSQDTCSRVLIKKGFKAYKT